MINFQVNSDKALESILYLSNKKPNIDHYHILKMLFYADKEHLNKYGRPIIGDTYIKMDAGPVPSEVLDIINFNCFRFSSKFFDKILESFIVTQSNKKKLISPLRKTNTDLFSESDIECLDAAFDFCKNKTFNELYNITHKEKAWKNAEKNKNMDYELFIQDDNPNKEDIIENLKQESSFLIF